MLGLSLAVNPPFPVHSLKNNIVLFFFASWTASQLTAIQRILRVGSIRLLGFPQAMVTTSTDGAAAACNERPLARGQLTGSRQKAFIPGLGSAKPNQENGNTPPQ